jgi:hypothetical protein
MADAEFQPLIVVTLGRGHMVHHRAEDSHRRGYS